MTARSNETSAPKRIDLIRGGKQILSARIEPVDAPGGVLNPPAAVVGWYAAPGWPVPGTQSRQHSILAGHVTWKGRPDVFARLGEARIGDLVLVTDSAGTVRRFVVVRGPVAIPKQQIAAAANAWVWSSDRWSNTLSLITCDPGSGVRTDGHLTGNIVVQARPG